MRPSLGLDSRPQWGVKPGSIIIIIIIIIIIKCKFLLNTQFIHNSNVKYKNWCDTWSFLGKMASKDATWDNVLDSNFELLGHAHRWDESLTK